MALQAQHIDLAYSQETQVRGTMGRVATGAAFRFHRHMLIHKGSASIGMALDASRVAAGQSLGLAERGSAMNVVAIAAMNQSFIYAMVIGPGKLSFGIGVARITLRGLFLNEQVLWLFCVMGRMAVKTTDVIAGVR
jgi:hypothetical protein